MHAFGAFEGLQVAVSELRSGDLLKEYQHVNWLGGIGDEGRPPSSECFLETVDVPFVIQLQKHKRFCPDHDLYYTVRVDGAFLCAGAWWQDDSRVRIDSVNQTDEEGKRMRADLVFEPMDTSDDPDLINVSPEQMEDRGIIEISLEYGSFKPKLGEIRLDAQLRDGVVDERAKKFPYTVKTGDRRPAVTDTVTYSFLPAPGREHGQAFYQFLFRYRHPVALELYGIKDKDQPVSPSIPCDRPSSPSESSSPDVQATSGASRFERPRPRRNRIVGGSDSPNSPISVRSQDDTISEREIRRLRAFEAENKRLKRRMAELRRNTRGGGRSKDDVIDLTYESSDEDG